jgi:hypothetical protein
MPGFLEYVDFVFVPFRAIYNKFLAVKAINGNIMVDVHRSQALLGRGKSVAKGFWMFKRTFCSRCEQQLHPTWDACPYCAQMAAQAAAASAKLQQLKTLALVVDAQGQPGSMPLLGWLVPVDGPHKGELFALEPTNTIGTDGSCSIALQDKFVSSKHADIRAEQGHWILRDTGSTNGTYVNNRRIDKHELVDNDFITFGSAMVKFKSL